MVNGTSFTRFFLITSIDKPGMPLATNLVQVHERIFLQNPHDRQYDPNAHE